MSKSLGQKNEFAKKSRKMKIPLQMDNKDYGRKTKAVSRNVELFNTKTGQVYGYKTVMTKENKLTLVDFLLQEDIIREFYDQGNKFIPTKNSDDITAQPEKVISEIKGLIRKGAADLAQKWQSALELVHKGYHVANVRRPTPDEKGAWKQYEELIRYGVAQLTATRGLNGDWRTSTVLVREFYDQRKTSRYPDSGQHIGTHRFFVEVPGVSAREIDAKSMDEIIEAISNKIRSDRQVTGTKVRVEERSKVHAILTVWVNDVKRERIIIKDVS